MKILFDQGVPVPLARHLAEHEVVSAYEAGLSQVANGELLRHADRSFQVLLTTDQNLRHQQNLSGLRLAILVLPTTSWPKIRRNLSRIVSALGSVMAGECVVVNFDAEDG